MEGEKLHFTALTGPAAALLTQRTLAEAQGRAAAGVFLSPCFKQLMLLEGRTRHRCKESRPKSHVKEVTPRGEGSSVSPAVCVRLRPRGHGQAGPEGLQREDSGATAPGSLGVAPAIFSFSSEGNSSTWCRQPPPRPRGL